MPRSIRGALVLAVLSGILGSLEGCRSEKTSPGPSRAPAATPAPSLEGGKTKLGDILVESATQEFGTPQLNSNVLVKPLSIGGQVYETGFGTHAASRIEISFPARYQTFAGSCGVDDQVADRGSIVFKILDGEQVLFESPLMRGGTRAADFSVPVNGRTRLTLLAENGGDNIHSDHADWVNLSLK